MVDQHLRMQHFSFLFDELVHWLGVLHSILYRTFRSLDETSKSRHHLHLRRIVGVILLLNSLCEVFEILHGQAIFGLVSLFPNLQILISQSLLLFAVLLSFLHSEDLAVLRYIKWTVLS